MTPHMIRKLDNPALLDLHAEAVARVPVCMAAKELREWTERRDLARAEILRRMGGTP